MARRASAAVSLGLGAEGEVEEGNRDLKAEADVVGGEVFVVGAVAVQLVGVVVVDGAESDERALPGKVVSFGLELLGPRKGASGLDAGEIGWSFIGGDGGNLRNAGVVRKDGADRQAGEHGRVAWPAWSARVSR